MRFVLLCLALCLPFAAQAQDIDCVEPATQTDMNICSQQAWGAADQDLNLAYQMAMVQARQLDQYIQHTDVPSEEKLREAQRAWIPFRDAACEAESFLVRGGSMQPTMYYSCLERLTRQRTADLRYFGEVN